MKPFQTLVTLAIGVLATVVVITGVPIEFPLDERPEGITEGPGSTIYVSQILSGKVLAIDADTGDIQIVVEEQADRQAWGLWYHEGHLLVAGGGPSFGGGNPEVYMYNVETGESVVACSPLTVNETVNASSFINDVTVLDGVAYATNSFSNRLMAMDVDAAAAGNCTVWELFLPDDFNPSNSEEWGANGIVPYTFDNGVSGLLVAHETFGSVWSVQNIEDDGTPPHYQILIYDPPALGADGLAIVEGNKLYVTQNSQNSIGVYNLTADDNGELFQTFLGNLTSPDYDTPATSAQYGGYLYSTNSRFFSLDEISDEADNNVIGVKNIYCCGNNATEQDDPIIDAPGGDASGGNSDGGNPTEAPAADVGAPADEESGNNGEGSSSSTESPSSGVSSRFIPGVGAATLGVGLLYLV